MEWSVNPEQEQDVVVARHHVLGAEIDEGEQVHPCDLLDVALVAFGYGVGEGALDARQQEQEGERERKEQTRGCVMQQAPPSG